MNPKLSKYVEPGLWLAAVLTACIVAGFIFPSEPTPVVVPKPPVVVVKPDAVIANTDGFRVCIAYDKQADNDKFNDVLYGEAVETWLIANTNGFYRWDDKPTFTNMPQAWRDIHAALMLSPVALPKVATIKNGKLFVFPLPDEPAAAISLLEKQKGL